MREAGLSVVRWAAWSVLTLMVVACSDAAEGGSADAIGACTPRCEGDTPILCGQHGEPLTGAPCGFGQACWNGLCVVTGAADGGLGDTKATDDAWAEDPGPASDAVCVPDCEDRVCGDDGCGGTCGKCQVLGQACVDGACVCDPKDQTACIGGDVYWIDSCGNQSLLAAGCKDMGCADGQCLSCAPACGGKQCGDDGCGGSCGTCEGAGQVCQAGVCVCGGLPTIACHQGDLWQFDACGAPQSVALKCDSGCVGNACTACAPDCAGKQCGGDGCGGSCGTCPLEAPLCAGDGACVECLSDGDCGGGASCVSGQCGCQEQVTAFATPSAGTTFVVDGACPFIDVYVWGGGGGGARFNGGHGGAGGFAKVSLAVQPGDSFTVVVGGAGGAGGSGAAFGQGGLNGGGAGGPAGGAGGNGAGGGGGGYSALVQHGDFVLVAGGGGGGGGNSSVAASGGAGGGGSGAAGGSDNGGGGGQPGTQVAGGAGGTFIASTPGQAGQALLGGSGPGEQYGGAGGGGGGWFGGGSGSCSSSGGGGGGGGGSGWLSPALVGASWAAGQGQQPGGAGEPHYVPGHGAGGAAGVLGSPESKPGGDGLVVIVARP